MLRESRRAQGTNGASAGTSGAAVSQLLRLFAVVFAFIALVDVINVFTALHDAARRGDDLPPWEPILWEATSGAGELIACPIVFAAFRLAPPGARLWGRTLLAHAGASVGFSILHVAMMMSLRMAIYGAIGIHYRVEAGAAVYEYRKDLLAYLVLGGLLHVFTAPRARMALAPVEPSSPAELPVSFDIIETSRTLRVRLDEIVAMRSLGNYVEFALADGRRPLMRTTLRELVERLAPYGFLQTHRSWLINPARVTGLERIGPGGHVVSLTPGVQVPVSRRFQKTLEDIRNRGVA